MKTFKVIKKVSLVLVFVLMGTFAFATSGEFMLAKQEMSKSVSRVFQDNIHNQDNYLMENQIYRLRETVKVTFKVVDENELKLLKVDCNNCDAAEYVKYVFAQNKVKAGDVLVGKVYAMNIFVRYRAK